MLLVAINDNSSMLMWWNTFKTLMMIPWEKSLTNIRLQRPHRKLKAWLCFRKLLKFWIWDNRSKKWNMQSQKPLAYIYGTMSLSSFSFKWLMFFPILFKHSVLYDIIVSFYFFPLNSFLYFKELGHIDEKAYFLKGMTWFRSMSLNTPSCFYFFTIW